VTTVAISVAEDRVVWQAVCERCQARYAVTQANVDNAPHPTFCVFCAGRPTFRIAPVVPAATF
jgi:hypothetical protein